MTVRAWAVAALACAALAHAGCGRRLIGRLPTPDDAGETPMVDADAIDGGVDGGADTRPVVPGEVAWKAEGWAAINAAGDFYTTAIHGDNVDVALVGRASGGRNWQRAGSFLCAIGDTVVVRDNKSWGSTVAGLAALDGAPRWQLGRMYMGFCYPTLDRFVAIETPDESQPTATLAVYGASDGRPVWSLGTAGVMASSPMVEGADASAVYFSWMESGKVMLRALRASDGHAQWTATLAATDRLHFQFDAAGALFAFDLSSQSPSVRRIDLARGSVAWTYPLAVGGELVTEGSVGFVVVRDGPNLLALDKETGTRLWTYPAQNDPSSQSWDVRFMRSGDLLVSQRSANDIPNSGMIAHTTLHTVVSATGAARWSVGPHTAVLPGASGPRTFLWETPSGELYETTYGVLARLDPTTGDRLWTSSDVISVDRVIGTDGDLVLVAGPPQNCCFLPEWVRAASKTNGQSRWIMSEQFPMGISLLTSDRDRIFLAAPPDAKYTPSTTVAIWK